MKSRHAARAMAAGILIAGPLSWVSCAPAAQRGAPPRPAREPFPQGQRINARDGDIVTVEDDARVRIVRRRQAVVRAVFNPSDRWVVLLIDHASPGGADGRVDTRLWYSSLSGDWPLAERWEGTAVIEEYEPIGQPTQGIGLLLPQGLIQILGSTDSEMFKDAGAIAVLMYRGSTGGTGGGVTFDEAERRQLSDIARNSGKQPTRARVGSSLRTPQKVHDVLPVYPESARQAGVSGAVLVELTVGIDGRVTAAKVLRSVPSLDQAAIDAVLQWRYEPELLDGKPVPFIVTAVVPFKP